MDAQMTEFVHDDVLDTAQGRLNDLKTTGLPQIGIFWERFS